MKLTTLFILLFALTVLGQKNGKGLYLTKDSDTLFWKKNQEEKIKEFNLPELDKKSDFVFRKWNPGSVLEIKKNKDSLVGKIIYFVFEVWEDDYKANKYVKEYELPKDTSKLLYEYIITSGFDTIPSEKLIDGWSTGFDGITHIYELKRDSTYSFKNYWTPKIQNGIKEAEFIINFNKRIGEIGNLEKYGKDFSDQVPFITYMYSGAAYAITKAPTKKEYRKYKRERKKRIIKNKR